MTRLRLVASSTVKPLVQLNLLISLYCYSI